MSTPKEKRFFEIYANLIKTLRKSGYAAQVVSGLTEVGGIYAAAYAALLPILPDYAMYAAGLIALLGTAVIELGLRKLLPHTVDSVLYKRFSGLHLPITILIWISAIILLGASGVLSFQNSKAIVAEVTPDVAIDSLALQAAQVNFNASVAKASEQFSKDSAMIVRRYASLIAASASSYDGKIAARQREYSNLKNREARTGRSYATMKDKVKAGIAELKAEKAEKRASLEAGKSEELSTLQSDFKSQTADARSERKQGIAEVKAANEEAEAERAGTVSTYGGGLAYFTIICLVILIVSIVLDRIHKKGSGIEERVSLSQYDISPSAWTELREAFRERWNYLLRSKIYAFAEKTPPAPLPVAKAPIYDSTEITEEVETIKYEEEEQEDNIIYLPKRRRIGFKSSCDLYSTRKKHETPTPTHEIDPSPETLNAQSETPELREMKQRLKMYKKRLGSHRQKAIKQEEKNGIVNKRTLDAIANNEHWVKHYEELINKSADS
jgi:hypothetical protein